MKRTHIAALLVLVVAVPGRRCRFVLLLDRQALLRRRRCRLSVLQQRGRRLHGAHRQRGGKPNLRMQLVDDPAAADFVLLDDSATANACADVSAIQSIRIDPAARAADLTVVLSRAARRLQDLCAVGQFLGAGRRRAVRGDLENRRPGRFRRKFAARN